MLLYILGMLPMIMPISDDAMPWDGAGANGAGGSPYGLRDDYYDDLPGWVDQFGPVTAGPSGMQRISEKRKEKETGNVVYLSGPTVPKEYPGVIYPKGANGPSES